jgi:2,3-bisphosphoglycerate-independent phosphoglycerate mutase
LLAEGKRVGFAVATMTSYDKDFVCPVLFPRVVVTSTLAGVIAEANLKQVHIAETEKYAHATYFLNCGRETPYENEKRIMIPSRRDVATYDQAPAMSAAEIAAKVVEEVAKGVDFVFVNFANADMVGHTGNYAATVEAIEAVDAALKIVVEAVQAAGGVVLITADHGNAEMNIDQKTGVKHTAHTLSPVPCIATISSEKLQDGNLADVAPTILAIMQLPKPASMTGQNLLSDKV